MTTGQIILGIALFAVAGAIVYAWGLKKTIDQQEDLERSLMSACGSRVMKYLKQHDTVSKAEVARLIEGMTVGPFWSRRKVKVQDGKLVGAVTHVLTGDPARGYGLGISSMLSAGQETSEAAA